MKPLALMALAALAALPSCGRVKDVTAAVLAKAGIARGEAAVPVSRLPREQIEKIGQPVIHVLTPSRGQDTLLVIRDRAPGDVLAWGAPDATLFTFRDGILIETRGLGSDLMSSSAPSPAQILSGEAYDRVYFVLGPDDRTERHSFRCAATSRGEDEITIYGRSHAVTHLHEECRSAGGAGAIGNDYWLDEIGVRKAREWVSPAIGHVWFERVID